MMAKDTTAPASTPATSPTQFGPNPGHEPPPPFTFGGNPNFPFEHKKEKLGFLNSFYLFYFLESIC